MIPDKIFIDEDLIAFHVLQTKHDGDIELIELNDGSLTGIYAVVDTENGEKMFEMDFAYSGEPIIMRVFLHKEFFMKHFWNRKRIEL